MNGPTETSPTAGTAVAGHESDGRYRALIEGMRAVVTEWAYPSTPAYVSPQFEQLTGRTVGEWYAAPTLWRKILHPADRERVTAVLDSQEDYDLEYRIVHAAGRIVWVRHGGRMIRDQAGRIVREISVILDVSAEREAAAEREEAVRASEALYRELIERQDAITWVSRAMDGGNLYISPQVEGILGYPAERWQEPGFWMTTLHPDDRERVLASMRGNDPEHDLEYRSVAADGRIVWFRERIRTAPDASEGLLRYGLSLDITAFKAVEEEVRERDQRLQEIIERVDAIVGYGTVSRVFYSDGIEKLIGIEPEALTTYEGWRERVHPDDLPACDAIWESDATSWLMQYRIRHAEGRWIVVRDRAHRVIGTDGKPERIYFVITDVTAAARLEEERRELELRVAQIRRLESLGRVAATTAHDFGNVLLGIDVFAKYLERNPSLDERARRDVAQVRAAVSSGRGAAASLVTLGNLDDPDVVETDVHALIRALEPRLVGLLGSGRRLALELDAAAPSVDVEPTGLERALENLVMNARDATAVDGTVAIATGVVEEDETTPTAAGIALPGSYLTIAVRDDGAGMTEATLARAFEPYFTTKPVGRGTGLGLSSVQAVAHAVDGHVHADSRPGEGTTIRICLPVH